MGNIRRAMWFERRKVLPKVPTNCKEALIALEGIQPRDGVIIKSDFDNDIGVIINTSSLKDEGLFFADGTFKSSPDQFYQIYTFIDYRKGHQSHLRNSLQTFQRHLSFPDWKRIS